MIQVSIMLIEVAFFKSTFVDAAGAVERKGKGKTPKDEKTCDRVLGMRLRTV